MKRAFLHVTVISTAATVLVGCASARTGCGEEEYSASFERIGVLRSEDGGATWTMLGNACFQAPELVPVDPSPLANADGIVLYFLDLKSLNRPGVESVIYRAESTDGLEFTQPEPVFQ